MGEPSFEIESASPPSDKRLDSWKEIAAYLNRDVTTVQRWEKREGMPVHRHLHEKRGSVYALAGELDAWVKNRRLQAGETDPVPGSAPPAAAGAPSREPRLDAARLRSRLDLILGLATASWLVLRPRPPAAQPPTIHSLAVLPLSNLSGDPSQDYLADGLTEALIGSLSEIHNLRVVSHTSVLRFSNTQLSTPQIAKMLGVDALVEGSVIRDGNRIRVTAQLIRGATDEHFWSETYDREMRDALIMESELAQAIADKVEVTVSGDERQRLGGPPGRAGSVRKLSARRLPARSGQHARGHGAESHGFRSGHPPGSRFCPGVSRPGPRLRQSRNRLLGNPRRKHVPK